MFNDIRFAFRTLRRHAGFTSVAVLTLALGIGANTALFSVADAVLLKPLPYPAPERIVEIEGAPFGFSPTRGMVVARAMTQSPAFSAVGMYATGGLNAGGDPGAERLRAAAVSPGFFGVMGSDPLIGRAFTEEDITANPRVAVISYGVWRTRFAGDPAVERKTITLNGAPYTVLGVMPRRFTFPEYSDVWIPVGSDSQISGAAFAPTTIARLASSVSPLQARDEVERINNVRSGGRRDPQELPVVVSSLREELVGAVRPLLILVGGAVLLVLLVSCINTANLLLTRVSAREREMSVRRALGATPGRLARYLMCESLVLSAMAGVVAIPAALWTLDGIRALLPIALHGTRDIGLDGRAMAATALLCLAASVIFGLAPALSIRGRTSGHVLRAGASTNDAFWGRFRAALVAAEIAAALVVLVGAVTVVRTVSDLMRTDLGARAERVLTLQLTLPFGKYSTGPQIAQLYDRLDERLRTIPGVETVGVASMMPGSREMGVGIAIAVESLPPPQGDTKYASYLSASADYFHAMGIDILAGRSFTMSDRSGSAPVAIIDQSVARALGREPREIIGRRLNVSSRFGKEPVWAEIVGVARDVRLRGPERPQGPAIYVPFAQKPSHGSLYVAVKTRGNPRDLAGASRVAIMAVDPDLPPYNVRSFEEIKASYVEDRRFAMALLSAFAVLTALLAAIGLYGVMSYVVQLRTREIGIRVALGATPAGVLRQMLRGGLACAGAGVVLGAAASLGVSRIFVSRVPGLRQIDPATLLATCAALLTLALLTVWLPARRAARIDPVDALRTEP